MRITRFHMQAALVLLLAILTIAGCGTSGENGPMTDERNNTPERDKEEALKNRPVEEQHRTEKKEKADDGLTRNAYRQPLPAASQSGKQGYGGAAMEMSKMRMSTVGGDMPPQDWNTESYDVITENGFKQPGLDPLSTLSIDVDVASYANVRRFVTQSKLPPKDAVRIEELINYFSYDYDQPKDKHPFSVTTELSDCPWNAKHKLVHIGLQGKRIDKKNLPSSNIVFLLDVSGSMNTPNKLPLLKKSFRLLVDEMRPEDRVAIVVYAGAAGLVLPSTAGDNKSSILGAIDQLEAGGSTAGGAGIMLAYKVARENFMREGNNRIIIATDGDFNIGASSDAEMVRLIEEQREHGIFLTVLGFGMGNYKDSKMEKLADKGNGNYAYIDDILEAKKTLVTEFGATLFTIAKDVKIQVEFNPETVGAYRLIGYENRLLNKEDFNDDKKDAGELGAGHTVTALYEIIPVGVKSEFIKDVDDLKYQKPTASNSSHDGEMMTVKLRYKKPDGDKSTLIDVPVKDRHIALKKSSGNFRFSAAVAAYGMLLRGSEFLNGFTYSDAISLARGALGKDDAGYRHDFLKMAERTALLASGS